MTVTCPKCLAEACVTVDVEDGDTLRCPECEESYSLADVVSVIQSWSKVLPWLLSHPARTPECGAVKAA
jgi:transcription elongation factor Elf1